MSAWRARLVAGGGALLVSTAVLLVPASPALAFSTSGPGGAAPTPASSVDRTVSTKAKASKTYRSSIPLTEWVRAAHAKYVATRESGGNCKAVSSGGTYRGKWQMGASFWSANGGKSYASRPDLATCAEQDKVAYRGWVASWWSPWGG
jgi:Transglycosylase-like domain